MAAGSTWIIVQKLRGRKASKPKTVYYPQLKNQRCKFFFILFFYLFFFFSLQHWGKKLINNNIFIYHTIKNYKCFAISRTNCASENGLNCKRIKVRFSYSPFSWEWDCKFGLGTGTCQDGFKRDKLDKLDPRTCTPSSSTISSSTSSLAFSRINRVNYYNLAISPTSSMPHWWSFHGKRALRTFTYARK